ncbi:MAG: hypothetical protein ACREOF_03275 [Gemmatimonadales bacterium]
MRRTRFLQSVAAGLILAVVATPAAGQAGKLPIISARQFTGGSAQVTVRGSVQIDQGVAINTQASVGDGEVTWLQFGASGSEAPNALITYGETGEIGVSVGKGKFVATAGIVPGEKPQCAGKTDVTGTSVSGHYTCKGVTSHDGATSKMGKVDIEVRFTAKS